MLYFFNAYMTQSIPETPCESTVANAAPKTPHLNTIINKRSSPIFKNDARIRKYSGVLLSPSALITQEHIL